MQIICLHFRNNNKCNRRKCNNRLRRLNLNKKAAGNVKVADIPAIPANSARIAANLNINRKMTAGNVKVADTKAIQANSAPNVASLNLQPLTNGLA